MYINTSTTRSEDDAPSGHGDEGIEAEGAGEELGVPPSEQVARLPSVPPRRYSYAAQVLIISIVLLDHFHFVFGLCCYTFDRRREGRSDG